MKSFLCVRLKHTYVGPAVRYRKELVLIEAPEQQLSAGDFSPKCMCKMYFTLKSKMISSFMFLWEIRVCHQLNKTKTASQLKVLKCSLF